MDVTDIVNSNLLGMFSNLDETSDAPDVDWADLGTIYENSEASYVPTDSHIDNNDKWCDWQLAVAAKLCADIRDAIYKELGYTCSAGKLLDGCDNFLVMLLNEVCTTYYSNRYCP